MAKEYGGLKSSEKRETIRRVPMGKRKNLLCRVNLVTASATLNRLRCRLVCRGRAFLPQAEKGAARPAGSGSPSWPGYGMPMHRSQRCRWSDELRPQCGADDRKRCHLNQFHTRIGIEPKLIITTSEKKGMSVGWTWLPACLTSSASLRCVLHALPLWI